jgi:hypothetical protein
MKAIAIIIDPVYGQKILDISGCLAIWLVDTAENSGAAVGARGRGTPIITYKCRDVDRIDRIANLRSMVAEVVCDLIGVPRHYWIPVVLICLPGTIVGALVLTVVEHHLSKKDE